MICILLVTRYFISNFEEALTLTIFTILDIKNGKMKFENFKLKSYLSPFKDLIFLTTLKLFSFSTHFKRNFEILDAVKKILESKFTKFFVDSRAMEFDPVGIAVELLYNIQNRSHLFSN